MKKMSWDEIKKLLNKKIHAIRRYDPDIIVAISRGGVVPAAIIAYLLKKPLTSMKIRLYEDGKNPRRAFKEPKLLEEFTSDMKNKKILLVDDVSNTGTTMKKAKAVLVAKKASKIKTFVINRKPGSDMDFYGMSSGDCILFPWS